MKKLLAVLLVLSAVFALSACSGSDTVKFGVIGPLTGDYAVYGTAVENGAKLAAMEINEDGGVLGKELEILAEDSEGDPSKGTNAYNKLVGDGIDALIGGTFSGVTLAIKELTAEDGMPVLSPTATNPDVTLDADNVFRACYTDSYQGEVAAVFAAEDLEATNVAVMYNQDDAYSDGLATAFMAKFDDLGLDYDEYAFGKDDADYSSYVTSIAAGSYDAVFLPAYVAEVGAILVEADSQGLDIPFIGGDGWDGIEADYGTEATGSYFANHYSKDDESQVVQDFVANYTAEFGEAPNALAALAYDAVYTMAAAVEAAGSTTAADVVAALAATDLTDLVAGAISFDENGDPLKAVTMIEIVDGEQAFYSKVSVD